MKTLWAIGMATTVALALAIPTVSLHAQTPVAGSHRGALVSYHLNAEVANRGVCFQMQPRFPDGSDWACLYQDNPLYREIGAVLLAARFAQSECEIRWNGLDGNQFRIVSLVDC